MGDGSCICAKTTGGLRNDGDDLWNASVLRTRAAPLECRLESLGSEVLGICV